MHPASTVLRAPPVSGRRAIGAVDAALRKLARGYRVDADGRACAQPTLEPALERAERALEILARVIREERLDLTQIRCSFCLKGHREVAKLIRGSQGYICDTCISTAVGILEKHAE